jgi:transcription initiation factor TFIIIB Brf1 subunit/transcription initiation factor TFIIB
VFANLSIFPLLLYRFLENFLKLCFSPGRGWVSGLWGSANNRPAEGEVVCTQCGLVVAKAAVDTGPEWRVFEKEKRVRTAPLKLVVKTDMAVKAEHGARWRRLAKFHRETLHGYERRLAKIGGEIRRVRECVGLPQSVAEVRRL